MEFSVVFNCILQLAAGLGLFLFGMEMMSEGLEKVAGKQLKGLLGAVTKNRLMQVEVETVNHIIHTAKKPVMTIKPMAAGRVSPFVGLNFVWNTIRPCDMVTVGCFDPEEAEEDVEISLAALERRRPEIGRRASPNANQDAFGNK